LGGGHDDCSRAEGLSECMDVLLIVGDCRRLIVLEMELYMAGCEEVFMDFGITTAKLTSTS
jgi:hypothetical protein